MCMYVCIVRMTFTSLNALNFQDKYITCYLKKICVMYIEIDKRQGSKRKKQYFMCI